MTHSETSIAEGLSEAQREAIIDTVRFKARPPMWLKVARPDLVAYHENTFGDFLAFTDLGLRIRSYLISKGS